MGEPQSIARRQWKTRFWDLSCAYGHPLCCELLSAPRSFVSYWKKKKKKKSLALCAGNLSIWGAKSGLSIWLFFLHLASSMHYFWMQPTYPAFIEFSFSKHTEVIQKSNGHKTKHPAPRLRVTNPCKLTDPGEGMFGAESAFPECV